MNDVVFLGDRAPKAHRGHPCKTGLVLPFSLGCAWNAYLIQVGNPAVSYLIRPWSVSYRGVFVFISMSLSSRLRKYDVNFDSCTSAHCVEVSMFNYFPFNMHA